MKHTLLFAAAFAMLLAGTAASSMSRAANLPTPPEGSTAFTDSVTGDRYYKVGNLWYRIEPFPARGVYLAGFLGGTPSDSITINAESAGSLSGVEYPINGILPGAFDGVKELKSVTFAPDVNLTVIGDSAFKGTSITTIDIPASVDSIGKDAFAGDPLKNIYLNEPSDQSHSLAIGDGAFNNYPAETLDTVFTTYHDAPEISDKVFPNAHEGVLVYPNDLTPDKENKYLYGTGWKEFFGVPTAIEAIPADNDESDLPRHFYTLSGIEIRPDHLTSGIYIMRQGKHTLKVRL